MNTKYIKAGNYFEVAITTDRSGRASIVIHENPHINNETIIDVELPCKTGEYKDNFKPVVRLQKAKVDVEELEGFRIRG